MQTQKSSHSVQSATATILLGAQWGDEGKGKVVDHLSERADIVVRFQGGNNAGHSLWVGGKKTVLHLIPSGILHPHTLCVVGEGVVLDPGVFQVEIARLIEAKVFQTARERLRVAERTHLILPIHAAVDVARETRAKGTKAYLGTTGRGIGPTYETRSARRGIRAVDLFDHQELSHRLEGLFSEYAHFFTADERALLLKKTDDVIEQAKKMLDPLLIDSTTFLSHEARQGKRFLFEGAQGVMLDVDHGTYPYVTSSSTTSPAAGIGAGVPKLTRGACVVGVAKAYATRVGSGPFPTEMLGRHVHGEVETGELIRKLGQEFGATTGRPRRIGWQDLVALKYAVEVAGIDQLSIMKGDVLTELKEFQVCTAYRAGNGKIHETYPALCSQLDVLTPVYETIPGWKVATPEDPNYLAYLNRIEAFVGVPVKYVGYGPEREAMVVRA